MTTTPSQTQGRMKPASIVYWFRFFLGILTAFASYYLRIGEAAFGEFALFVAIGFALVFYLVSVLIVRYLLRYDQTQLKGKNRYITLGGGTFVVMWVMVSVLLNTLRS